MSDLSYMSGKGYSRGTDASKEQVNQWSGHLNDGRLVNKGRGPTVGNKGSQKAVMPPISPVPSKKSMMGDNNNIGGQVRNPGGTRSWEPKCEQNYRGNPNSINVGRGPTKGNQ